MEEHDFEYRDGTLIAGSFGNWYSNVYDARTKLENFLYKCFSRRVDFSIETLMEKIKPIFAESETRDISIVMAVFGIISLSKL